MPDQAEADAHKAAEDRHVTFYHQQVSLEGTTVLEAELDLADALDFDAAITAEAEALRLAGCTESLDVRRAIAAGRIARRHLGLDLDTTRHEHLDEATPSRSSSTSTSPRPRSPARSPR